MIILMILMLQASTDWFVDGPLDSDGLFARRTRCFLLTLSKSVSVTWR